MVPPMRFPAEAEEKEHSYSLYTLPTSAFCIGISACISLEKISVFRSFNRVYLVKN